MAAYQENFNQIEVLSDYQPTRDIASAEGKLFNGLK
jgi:hypothetical protein